MNRIKILYNHGCDRQPLKKRKHVRYKKPLMLFVLINRTKHHITCSYRLSRSGN